MRIALAKILLSRPDFAILDEPTNHLDILCSQMVSRLSQQCFTRIYRC